MSVYLDWAATSPPDPAILSQANEKAILCYGNPSSGHAEGKKARELLEEARSHCANALGIKPNTVIFTSGGTEADYLPLLALNQRPVRGSIAISAIEHPAIREQAKMMEHTGWEILTIPVTSDGFITPEAVIATIRRDTAFVAVMSVNNETGAIQPISEIAQAILVHCAGKKKPHFHVDAVQGVGKTKLLLSTPGIDSASISGHKIQGPRGIGILYLAHRVEPYIRGGEQEGGLRPGTENIFGAWALSLALEKHISSFERSDARALMAYLISSVTAIEGIATIPETRQVEDSRFSPWITQFTNTKLPGEVLVRTLSDRGVYISMGSACSSRKKTRPVLEAMNISQDKQQKAFRISIGITTTKAEIDAFISVLSTIQAEY